MPGPVPAEGQPTVGGLVTNPVTSETPGASIGAVALGYAHADVARVVVRVPDGKLLSVSTFAAGWRGSDLRLWAVKLPKDSFNFIKGNSTAVTATNTPLKVARRTPAPKSSRGAVWS